MKQSAFKHQLFVALIQLVLVALACILGYVLSREMNLIPSAVLRLPEVYVSTADMWSLTRIFVVIYLIQNYLRALDIYLLSKA